jgi:hypothetical protein
MGRAAQYSSPPSGAPLYIALAVFGFLLAHGASITLTLRGERQVERLRALLKLSKRTGVWTNAFLLVVLATGIAAGFLGHWWGQRWIWAALGVLALIYLSMDLYGLRPFERIRAAVEHASATDGPPSDPVAKQEELTAALRSFQPLPLTLMGGIGLLALLWLMRFKPS